MDYLEKLKDPRWQKKRLQILERDEWRCKACASADKPLHVHHLFYLKRKEPWQIPKGFLVTLCEDCHSEERELSEDEDYDSITQEVALLLNTIWASGYDMYDLQEIGMAIAKVPRPPGPAIDCEFSAKEWVPPKRKE